MNNKDFDQHFTETFRLAKYIIYAAIGVIGLSFLGLVLLVLFGISLL